MLSILELSLGLLWISALGVASVCLGELFCWVSEGTFFWADWLTRLGVLLGVGVFQFFLVIGGCFLVDRLFKMKVG